MNAENVKTMFDKRNSLGDTVSSQSSNNTVLMNKVDNLQTSMSADIQKLHNSFAQTAAELDDKIGSLKGTLADVFKRLDKVEEDVVSAQSRPRSTPAASRVASGGSGTPFRPQRSASRGEKRFKTDMGLPRRLQVTVTLARSGYLVSLAVFSARRYVGLPRR